MIEVIQLLLVVEAPPPVGLLQVVELGMPGEPGTAAAQAVAADLATETGRAEAAEQVLADDLAAETSRAEAAETTQGAALAAHVADHANPHIVTKSQVGLGNADNTSDANKPVSTAQQAAIDNAISALVNGAPGALNTLKELADQLGADETAASAVAASLAAHTGNTNNPHAVTKAQVGLGNADNTSDANKVAAFPQATTSTQGKVEIATSTEAIAGTDTDRAVPPSALAAGMSARAADAPPSTIGARTGSFDSKRSLYLPSGVNLDAVRAKLAKSAALSARCKIAWVGTSIVAGYGTTIGTNHPPLMLRSFLGRRYGTVGNGMVPVTNGCTNRNTTLSGTTTITGSMDDSRWTFTGTWVNAGSPRNEDMQFHLTSTVAGSTLTFTSDVAGTAVDIYYWNNSRAFTYSIDGGAPVTVTPSGAQTMGVTTVTGLANTTHTVVLTVAGSSGTFFPLGVAVRSATGIEVANLGYYGSITADWLPTSISSSFFNGHKVVTGYAPDIALVSLGPNELIHGTSGQETTVRTNLNTIIAAYKTAGILPVIVVDPPIEDVGVTTWASAFEPAIWDVADTQSVPLVDLTHAWRNRTAAAALGYYFDQWHPTGQGAASMAEVVVAALSR